MENGKKNTVKIWLQRCKRRAPLRGGKKGFNIMNKRVCFFPFFFWSFAQLIQLITEVQQDQTKIGQPEALRTICTTLYRMWKRLINFNRLAGNRKDCFQRLVNDSLRQKKYHALRQLLNLYKQSIHRDKNWYLNTYQLKTALSAVFQGFLYGKE